MTQVITSLEQGVSIAQEALRKLQQNNQHASLAGGFLRDITAGIQPKDMDFYMDVTRQGIEAELVAHGEALGCTWNEVGGAYDHGLSVYESVGLPEDQFPVQLIFTPRGEVHPLLFDIGICEQYMWNPNMTYIDRSALAKRDIENKTLTVNLTADSFRTQMFGEPERVDLLAGMQQFLGHLRRVMEKFPDHRVVFSQRFIQTPWGREVYDILIQENIIGDPRTLFPAQGQEPSGDEVRQQDGATGGIGYARSTTASYTEAVTSALRDRAQVQSRPPIPFDSMSYEQLASLLGEQGARSIFALRGQSIDIISLDEESPS